MADGLSEDISDFQRRDFTFDGKTKPVFIHGDRGPAVIVIHPIYGFTPSLARFCRWIGAAGMRVYAPILLGKPDASNKEDVDPSRFLQVCISREFTVFAAGKKSAVVDWLKPLARQAHAECGGPGVGVIGMCLTGGFGLAMAVDPVVLAPVLSQPSMPPRKAGGIDASPEELAAVRARNIEVRGYRFEGDAFCKKARFDHLSDVLGDSFIRVELKDKDANPNGIMKKGMPPHSVFTQDLIDAPNEPTRKAADEVIAFFAKRLGV